MNFTISEEGWEPAKTTRKHRETDIDSRAIKAPSKPTGFEFFRSKMEGRCFNCFSPNHIARSCTTTHRCWKCYHTGHRAVECSLQQPSLHKYRGVQEPEATVQKLKPPPPPRPPPSLPGTGLRSYAEAVRGTKGMATARYPGDPRARPARAYCAMTATGSIRRRRDDLVNRAVVCWLYSNSHETEAHHLGDAIRTRLRLRHEDIQIVKHYPEQFLVIFSEPAYKEQLLDWGTISDGGRDFHFAPWNERRNAVNYAWEFRVKVRIEGIPVHCWAEEVAAQALGRSCAVHYLEEKTRRRQRTRTFDLWAWCCDPCDIPKEVHLTVTEPDREQPPTSIPSFQAPPHHDEPVDIKRAHVYTLRNHLEWVEDLTFLQGRGRMGGPLNRKPRRELVWSYGAPDSVGERPPGRQEDRGQGFGRYQRRDDEDHDDDQDRRNRGTRRHRSVSTWARNSRCRGAMDDCISSNRWRGGRGSPLPRSRGSTSHRQATALVWRVKSVKDKPKPKKVTFADPIATVLKAPKPAQKDDSIMLIKELKTNREMEKGDTNKDTTLNIRPTNGVEVTKEPAVGDAMAKMGEVLQQAMLDTLKRMEGEAILPCNQLRPLELSKMEAIQALIEHGIKQNKASTIRKRMAAQVGRDA